MLPQILILAGVIIVLITLFKKNNLYHSPKSKNKSLQQPAAASNEEFEEICSRLDYIINNLSKNQKEISNELSDLKDNFDTKDNQKNSNFNSLLQQYEQKASQQTTEKKLPKKYKQVLQLVSEGKSSEEIARELKLGIRETNMILNLYRRKADNHGK